MFLANENFPYPSTQLLSAKGYMVKSIQEEYAGISDEEVIEIAVNSKLIMLTFDSDYGELIFKYAKANPPSVVFFREKGQQPEFAARSLLSLLQNTEIKLVGAFTVVEQNSIRQRFYKNT